MEIIDNIWNIYGKLIENHYKWRFIAGNFTGEIWETSMEYVPDMLQ